MTYYGLSGTITAQPGKRDELVTILLKAANLLEQNEDCIHYVVATDDTLDTVSITEVWRNKAGHDASLSPTDIRTLVMSAKPLIKDMSKGIETVILGGKGLPHDH